MCVVLGCLRTALPSEIGNLTLDPYLAHLHFEQVLHPPQQLRDAQGFFPAGASSDTSIHKAACSMGNTRDKSVQSTLATRALG